jgi:hypothetical protein
VGGFLLTFALCSIYAFVLTKQRSGSVNSPNLTSGAISHSGKAELGQFPPDTKAESELAKMLAGKDKDIDLALANWLIAADIPQFADMTRDEYFAQLDEMTDQVREEMVKMQQVAASRGKNLDDPDTRCTIFCNALIRLGFDYAQEYRLHDLTPEQDQSLHGDANNTFLAGLIRNKHGSCISMPLIYLVIGQRLHLPVHLVAIGRHYFIRWQESGYRMNIETTQVDHVWVTDDDSAYVDEEGMTRDQVKGSDLRNLTNREVIGHLFFTRSAYWAFCADKSRSRSWVDLSRAMHLAPDDPAIQRTHNAVFSHYKITPKDTLTSLKQKERNAI